jgi:WD repeat-containing protein 19
MQLALGTIKGDVLLYNHRTARKVPIQGLHSKAILTGGWSDDGNLALGAFAFSAGR